MLYGMAKIARQPGWESSRKHPELKSTFAKIGIAPRGTTPPSRPRFTRSEYEKWKQVMVDGNIKPESPLAFTPSRMQMSARSRTAA